MWPLDEGAIRVNYNMGFMAVGFSVIGFYWWNFEGADRGVCFVFKFWGVRALLLLVGIFSL